LVGRYVLDSSVELPWDLGGHFHRIRRDIIGRKVQTHLEARHEGDEVLQLDELAVGNLLRDNLP